MSCFRISTQSSSIMLCTDILLNVLIHALPTVELVKERHTTLTTFRLVCSDWNDIVISTSSFWSNIYIHLPSSTIPLSVIQTWLERSKNADLDLTLKDSSTTCTPAEIGIRRELICVIRSHISQCRSLRVDISEMLMNGLGSLHITEGRRLEYLSVNMRGNITPGTHRDILWNLSILPKLRCFSWSSDCLYNMKFLFFYDPPSLSSLTDFEVTCSVPIREMLKLMRQISSAIRITVPHVIEPDTLSPSPTIIPPFSPFTLPNLHTLDVTYSDIYHILLQHFFFPNLKALAITSDMCHLMASTIRRLAPSLEFLKLNLWIHHHNCDEIYAFLHHKDIFHLPILEVQSRGYFGSGVDECPFWSEIFSAARTESRVVEYEYKPDMCLTYRIAWIDSPTYNLEHS